MGLIFDLDQTLINSSCASIARDNRNWQKAKSLIPQFTIYEGIIESLTVFRESGHKICIVTSSISNYCDAVIKYWGIPHDFQVCYHDAPRCKPHSDPIDKAIQLLNQEEANILSFGDKNIDIIASRSANVKSVACTWGSDDIDSLIRSSPDFVVHNATELQSLVQTFYNQI